jgi:hypothetical protein
MADWSPEVWIGLGTLASVGLTAWLNHRAHSGITRRIDGVDRDSRQRDEDLAGRLETFDRDSRQRDEAHRAALDSHRSALESIARDVSFLAGRQAERDQQADR